jgi:pilus assembly protein FimV
VEYGPVQNGETLWGIARNLSRDTGLGINQTMIAIQRENPNAFLRGNINLLKRGAILRLPSAEQVAGVSRADANREVELQAEVFAERRSAATAASPETPLLAAEAAAEPAEPAPSVEEPPAPEADEAEPTASEEATQETAAVTEADDVDAADQPEPEAGLRDQLELVPPAEDSDAESAGALGEPEAEGDSAAAVASLRENLARTEEELYNQRQQNAYLEERIRDLEAQAEARSGGVEDEELANMEERLRQERQAAAAARDEPLPWYANLTLWLFVLLGVAIVVIVWLLLRGRKGPGDSLVGITGEAEEVLRVLEDEEKLSADDEQPAAEEAEATVEKKTARTFGEIGDDAEFLDAESSDPEIQLDLARAYISMGDKEAARVILEEVVANGSEEQKAEAEKMLDLL